MVKLLSHKCPATALILPLIFTCKIKLLFLVGSWSQCSCSLFDFLSFLLLESHVVSLELEVSIQLTLKECFMLCLKTNFAVNFKSYLTQFFYSLVDKCILGHLSCEYLPPGILNYRYFFPFGGQLFSN